jgi:hypothetical protein
MHLSIPKHTTLGLAISPLTLAVQPSAQPLSGPTSEATICNHKSVNKQQCLLTREPWVPCLLFSYVRIFPDMPLNPTISLK